MAFPGRFGGKERDPFAELQKRRLLTQCEALLSEDDYTGPLAELDRQLVRLLAPQSVNPQDSRNVVLGLWQSYQDGLAELERVGHRGEMTLYEYLHRLESLEKRTKT